jgi:hypothetical protein
MKLSNKCLTFFLLFVIAAFNCRGQESSKKNNKDTTVPKAVLGHFNQTIYFLQEKVKLQQYELRVLKELGKVDSVRYGKDSLITLYTSRAGKPLMRVTQKYVTLQNKNEDSIVVYYHKNGLIEYSEMWQIREKQKRPSSEDPVREGTKLTCRRYEYDDQNRIIHYVVNYPTPSTLEYIYTYDSAGNVTKNGQTIRRVEFWDEIKKTSPK